MRPIGWFRCGKCGERRRAGQRALRSPWRRRLGVCLACLRQWERTGHRCGRCWEEVQDLRAVGLLVEKQVFAHAECGAALLARTGLPAGTGAQLPGAAVLRGLSRLLGWDRVGAQGGEP